MPKGTPAAGGPQASNASQAGPTAPADLGRAATPPTPQLAREKVKQARSALTKYQFDEAERLAQEAERLNQPFSKGEDNPRDVLRDVSKGATIRNCCWPPPARP